MLSLSLGVVKIFIVIMSIQNIYWGEGFQGPCSLFQNLKMLLFQKNDHFIASFIYMPFGEEGGLQNEVVLSTCEIDNQKTKN